MFDLAKLMLTLRIDEVFSLKQKRSIIKQIKTHVISAYNACIAESHDQDSLRYIGITIGLLSKNEVTLRSQMMKIIQEVEFISEGFVEKDEIEII